MVLEPQCDSVCVLYALCLIFYTHPQKQVQKSLFCRERCCRTPLYQKRLLSFMISYHADVMHFDSKRECNRYPCGCNTPPDVCTSKGCYLSNYRRFEFEFPSAASWLIATPAPSPVASLVRSSSVLASWFKISCRRFTASLLPSWRANVRAVP